MARILKSSIVSLVTRRAIKLYSLMVAVALVSPWIALARHLAARSPVQTHGVNTKDPVRFQR